MPSLIPLPRPFASRDGVPIITRVDARVFLDRYFAHCLQCGFCHDWCCSHGVDVELTRVQAILRHAPAIEKYTGIPRTRWFEPPVEADREFPGGGAMRTRVEHGRCVFHNRVGRGCQLHGFAVAHGMDYHEVKSIVDCLFPLTWEGNVLCAADEVTEGALVCMDQGPTLYRGVRAELAYYFGDECVAALDAIEAAMVRAA